jgi:hypothetical protein
MTAMMKRFLCVAATSVSFLAVKAQDSGTAKPATAVVAEEASPLQITRTSDSVLLAWKIPASVASTAGIKSFIVYRSENSDIDFTNPDNVLVILPSLQTTYADVGVDRATTYYYSIALINQLHQQQPVSPVVSAEANVQQKKHFKLEASAIDNQQVNLKWFLEQESAGGYFDIEKSINGRDYTVIAKMSGGRQLQFETTDLAGVAGTVYYRLKMVDKTATAYYSNAAVVRLLSAGNLVKVYPNILLRGDVLTIKNISENNLRIDYTLMNSSGKIESKGALLPVLGTRNIYETRTLPSGRYVLQVIQGNQHQVIQVMVQ